MHPDLAATCRLLLIISCDAKIYSFIFIVYRRRFRLENCPPSSLLFSSLFKADSSGSVASSAFDDGVDNGEGGSSHSS